MHLRIFSILTRPYHLISSETAIVAWHDNRVLNQAWFIEGTGGTDTYTIRNVSGGSYMDLSGGMNHLNLLFCPSTSSLHSVTQPRPTTVPKLLDIIKTTQPINIGWFVRRLVARTSKSFSCFVHPACSHTVTRIQNAAAQSTVHRNRIFGLWYSHFIYRCLSFRGTQGWVCNRHVMVQRLLEYLHNDTGAVRTALES